MILIRRYNILFIYKLINLKIMAEEPKDEFGRPFPKKSPIPMTAADCVVIRDKPGSKGEYEILLITRKKPGPS